MGKFSLGLDEKDNFNVSDINVAPSAAHKDPPQRPETKPDTESQTEAITATADMQLHSGVSKKRTLNGGKGATNRDELVFSTKKKQ